MNETTIDVDQTDEDILTYTVSDEALEAAAARTKRGVTFYNTGHPIQNCSWLSC